MFFWTVLSTASPTELKQKPKRITPATVACEEIRTAQNWTLAAGVAFVVLFLLLGSVEASMEHSVAYAIVAITSFLSAIFGLFFVVFATVALKNALSVLEQSTEE